MKDNRLVKTKEKQAASTVNFRVRADGVAIITIHNPPKNTLNNHVMAGLEMRFREAYARIDVKAIVLTGSKSDFSLGVDISLFQKVQRNGCDDDTQFVPPIPFVSMIEDGPKPVVAAVQGFAIGGGLELMLACHSRVVYSNAKFALPDLHLGIIPGLGGTQRLPRLVGVKRTLQILWMTRPLTAMEAMKAGLVDEVVVTGDVLTKACDRALEIHEKRFAWKKSLERTDRLEPISEVLQILRRARSQSRKDHPNLIHPLLCIDVIEEGVLKGGLAGAALEEKFSHGLVYGPTAKGLMHVFFARRLVTKIPSITDKGLKPQKISRASVVGCGLTGAAIVTSFILSKIPVYLKGDSKSDLQAGLAIIEENLEGLASNGTISQGQLKSLAALVTGMTDYEHFHDVDLVVEALEESIPNRHEILQGLAQCCQPDTILVSNSSSFDLHSIPANGRHIRNRILGMHFVSPAHKTELVEVSLMEKTSPQTVLDIFALVQSMRKLPLAVKSSAGLVVDRLCFVCSISRMVITELGVDRCEIDALLRDFGMTMSSLGFSECQSRLLHQGFQNYSGLREVLGCTGKKVACIAAEEILDMLLFPIVNEAYKILHDGIVEMAEHIDIASILGMGFPSYRGGIVFWARAVGTNFIISQLLKWSKQYGVFFQPCSYLHASSNQVKDQVSDQAIARL